MSIAGDTQARVPGFYSQSETVISANRIGTGISTAPTTIVNTGINSVVIGNTNTNTSNNNVLVGYNNSAGGTGGNLVVFGRDNGAGGTVGNVVQVGRGNSANPSFSVTGMIQFGIGNSSSASGGGTIVQIGSSNTGGGAGAISLGNSNTNASTQGVCIGSACQTGASTNSQISIGSNAICAALAGNTFAMAIGDNASGAGDSGIAIGRQSSNSGTQGIAFGRSAANGQSSGISIGYSSATEFAGQINLCNARFANAADIATSTVPMYMTTTTAAATDLATSIGTVTTTPTGTLTCTNNSTYIFEVDIVAKSASNAGAAAWNLKFAFDRQGSAATSEISALSKTIMYTRGTTTGWDVTATADTTNGRPNITVTGAAATTIRWVGNVKMTKVAH